MTAFNLQSATPDRWKAADFVGHPHIISSRGETREMDDTFGDDPTAKKDVPMMNLVVPFENGEPVGTYEDVLIFQTFGKHLRTPGVYLVNLTKRGNAFVLEDVEGSTKKLLFDWLGENCDNDGGAAVLKSGASRPNLSVVEAVEGSEPF